MRKSLAVYIVYATVGISLSLMVFVGLVARPAISEKVTMDQQIPPTPDYSYKSTTEPAEFTGVNPPELDIIEHRLLITTDGKAYIVGSLLNGSSSVVKCAVIKLALINAKGVVIGETNALVSNVEPSGQAEYKILLTDRRVVDSVVTKVIRLDN